MLLYVGRVSAEKNLSCLTDAFRRLCRRRRDIGLVVVGDGPYRARMERELKGLPAVFTGVQQGEDLSRTYASCDLFLFPSETDTFGVVIIEAQASGLPVMVSARGGPRDCMQEDVTGRVVRPMTPEALCAETEGLLNDPAAWMRMGQAARRHARTMTPAASFEAFWEPHRRLAVDAGRLPAARAG
jgi:glycosyltransferase involved in cell wall biosynthesis